MRLLRDVLLEHQPIIHAIQLIAAQDEQVIETVIQQVRQVFAHRVGGSFVP